MTTTTSRIDQGPSVSAGQIAAELSAKGGPLVPYAQTIYDKGRARNVDPAFFLGVCWGENNYGLVGAARTTYNWCSVSNGLYGGWPVAGSRWGQYPTPEAGIDAFFQLIAKEYYPNGQTDLFSIWWGVGGSSTRTGTHAYAPAFENPPSSLDTVVAVMNRVAGQTAATTPPGAFLPPLPPTLGKAVPIAAIVLGILALYEFTEVV